MTATDWAYAKQYPESAACLNILGLPRSFDTFAPFNFFNFAVSHFSRSPTENSATYGCAALVCAVPYCEREKANEYRLAAIRFEV
jgi:hypothetical protein